MRFGSAGRVGQNTVVVVAALSEERRAGAGQIWWTPDGVQATVASIISGAVDSRGAKYMFLCIFSWLGGGCGGWRLVWLGITLVCFMCLLVFFILNFGFEKL